MSGNEINRKYWAFIEGKGKPYITLQIYEENPHGLTLIDAYNRHPKKLPAGVNVEFAYRDDATNQIIRKYSMAEIIACEEEMRQIMEDAAKQDEEARCKAAEAAGIPPWSR